MKTTVVIVEDHADLRESWAEVLAHTPGFRCVGALATGEEALAQIPAINPDVVLMDINLPGMSGIECIHRLKAVLPSLQVLILTVYDDHDRIFQALQAGASGYLLKRTSPQQLIDAITEVKQGGAPMTSEVARKVVQSFRQAVPATTAGMPDARLTPREEEILQLLARGFVPKEIAQRLDISYFTAQTHVKRIYEKLHVRSRTEAVLKYLR